jgi:hypothetical protein
MKLTLSTTEIKLSPSSPVLITRKHTAEGQKESPILVEKYGMVVLSYLLDIFDTFVTSETRSVHSRPGSPKIEAVEEVKIVKQSGPRLKRGKSFFDKTEEQIKQIQKKQNIFGYECTYIWLIRYITDVTGAPDSFLGLLDGLIKEVVERDKDLYQRISEMVPNNDDDEPKEKILLQLYLEQDFKNCWAVISHNSSPGVAAAIEGIPVFVTDPVRSQVRDVANTDLSKIENPTLPDREQCINRISQFHWSHDELKSGECWQHMKGWAIK